MRSIKSILILSVFPTLLSCSPRFMGDSVALTLASTGNVGPSSFTIDTGPFAVLGGGQVTFTVDGVYSSPIACQVVSGGGSCSGLTYTAGNTTVEMVQVKVVDGAGYSSEIASIYNLYDVRAWINASDMNGNGDNNAGWNDNDSVLSWNDASATGTFDFAAFGAASSPNWRSSRTEFDGYPAVYFTSAGGNRCLQNVSNTMLNANDTSRFFAVSTTSVVTGQVYYADGNGNSTNAAVNAASTGFRDAFSDGVDSVIVSRASTADVGHVVGSVLDSATKTMSMYYDGAATTNTNASYDVGVFSGGANAAMLGTRQNAGACGTAPFLGYMAEGLIYKRMLTSTEAGVINCYLSTKYDLGISGC